MTDEKEKNEVVVPSYDKYNKTLTSHKEEITQLKGKVELLEGEIAERDEKLLKKDKIIENKDYTIKEKIEAIKAEEARRKEAENKILANSPYGYHRSANETKEQKFEREYKEGLEKFGKNSFSNRINK